MRADVEIADWGSCGVYKIECFGNGKLYIGSTRTKFGERFSSHERKLRRNRHENAKLQASYNKYGSDTFSFSIVEKCPSDMAFDREQHFIDTLIPKLNIKQKVSMGVSPSVNKTAIEWNDFKNKELLILLHGMGILKLFANWSGPVRVFFGLPWPEKRSELTKARIRIPKCSKARYGGPKSEAHKAAIGAARLRYIERLRLAGEWPPKFYVEKRHLGLHLKNLKS